MNEPKHTPAQDGLETSSDYRAAYRPARRGGKKPHAPAAQGTPGPRARNPRPAAGAGADPSAAAAAEEPQSPAQSSPAAPELPERDDFLPQDERKKSEARAARAQAALGSLDAEAIAQAARRPRRRRRYGIALGAAVLLLALVGVGFLAATAGTQIYRALTDDSALRAYDEFLTPVVMQDPEPFEDIADADPEMVLTASVWRAIMEHGREYNEYDELGRTIVPLVDVADACEALFGPDCEFHPERAPEDTFYLFDAEDNTFRVTPYSSQSSFIPYTVSSRSSGASTVLRVGYVSASDEWRTGAGGGEPEPVKYMEYVLLTNSETNTTYISAIRSFTSRIAAS